MVYQFTVHSNLPQGSAAPVHKMFTLYGKLMQGKKLTSEEKEYITDRLWGVMGAHSHVYKLGGFAADFSRFLPTILVKQYGSWQEYVAPNKTLLRKVLYGTIDQMSYLN